MRGKLRILKRQLPLLIIWAVLSSLIWSWIFMLVTEPDARHKLVIAVDAAVSDVTELAVSLESSMEGDIQRIKVYPFTYAMMDSSTLEKADLLILSAEGINTYLDWLAPLPAAIASDQALSVMGIAYGLPLKNPLVLRHLSGDAGAWYVCLGQKSIHAGRADGQGSEALPYLTLLSSGASVD